jgi:hypothetical protein
MPISEQDKLRLQKYLDSKGLPPLGEAVNLKSKPSEEQDEMPDILGLIVESLYTQTLQNSSEIAAKTEKELEVFKSKLTVQIFNQALVLAAEDQSNFDRYLVGELTESESFEEIILKVGVYVQGFPEFAYKLVVYTIATYILYCLQYKMVPNERILSIYSVYLNN